MHSFCVRRLKNFILGCENHSTLNYYTLNYSKLDNVQQYLWPHSHTKLAKKGLPGLM